MDTWTNAQQGTGTTTQRAHPKENYKFRENLISAIEKRSKERDIMIQQLFQPDIETDETDLFF